MDKYGNMTRKKACYILGIRENASEEQIKRAYRYKAKLLHPDANPDKDTKEFYINVQMAYEYLMNNPYPIYNSTLNKNTNPNAFYNSPMNTNSAYQYNNYSGYNMYTNNQMYNQFYQQNQQNVRPARVYASTEAARTSYQRQKEKEKEREKLQKWDEENKNAKRMQQQEALYGKKYAEQHASGFSKNKEEEILAQIRAIWIAETIRRQIALDEEHKEILQRRKINKAFMQQKLQEEDL